MGKCFDTTQESTDTKAKESILARMIKEPKEGASNRFETQKEETEFQMKIFKEISKRN